MVQYDVIVHFDVDNDDGITFLDIISIGLDYVGHPHLKKIKNKIFSHLLGITDIR